MGGGGEGQSGEPETVLDRSAECAALFAGRNRSLLAEDALAGLKVGVYQHSTVARDMMVVLRRHDAAVHPPRRSEIFITADTAAVVYRRSTSRHTCHQ